MEKTDLNVSPYYDDFNESKKFHRVLFRAGRPIQARELTQAQSILQNQIERFSDHVFEEGSIVLGAQSDADFEYHYVKVKNTNPESLGTADVESYRASFHDKYLQGGTTGIVAKVVNSTAETTDDSLTLFVKYLAAGTDTNNSRFFDALEVLSEVTVGSDGSITSASNNNQFQVESEDKVPTGRGSAAAISEGIVYVRGYFVKVDAQTVILEKYSPRPSYRIGLDITESLVSSANDSTLLDNAQGSSNENAPGADRLKIDFNFAKKGLTTTTDVNFIELLRVNNGIIENKVSNTNYSEIENTLARRTFDESGDYVVQQFTTSLREHLDDGTNRGYYSEANGGDSTKFVVQVSPGKAYVKGFEIEKTATTPVSIQKARTTQSLTAANTPVRIGNYLKVTDVHSEPEFGNESGDDTQAPYNYVKLWDTAIATPGTAPSSIHIGYARVRNFDHLSGTSSTVGNYGIYDQTDNFQMYLFDVKMFTKITYSGKTGTFSAGDQVRNADNTKSGIVAYDASSNLYLHDVVGNWDDADSVTSYGTGSGAISAGQNTATRNYNIDRVRGVSQVPNNSARETFTADVVTDNDFILTGTVSLTSGSTTVTGFGSLFSTELKEGDILVDSAGNERIVSSIAGDTSLTLSSTAGSTQTGNITRRRTKIYNQEQTVAITSWARDYVSNHTPDQLSVRRQIVDTVASQQIAIETQTGETFDTITADNFILAVVEPAGGGNLNAGDIIDVSDNTNNITTAITTSGSQQTLTISGFDAADDGAILKVTYTVDINSPQNRDKNLKSARVLKVGSARTAGGFYGTAYDDKEITLGVSDAFKLRAVYEGVDGADAITPSFTVTQTTSAGFDQGEVIVGQTSGARGVMINYGGTGNTSYYYLTSTTAFTDGESIIGSTSTAAGTLGSLDAGSKVITNNYFFDDGQRDGFYDLAKIVRKPGAPAPVSPVMVVFDYFTSSGSGDFYDVNSYNGIDYDEIPQYISNRVDPESLEPDGEYELRDAVDFRPSLGQILGTTTFSTSTPDPSSPVDLSNSTSGAVRAPYYYENKSFESSTTGVTASGASIVDMLVPGSNVVGDLTFYVGRIDKLYLHKTGSYQVVHGTPSLSPTKPAPIDDAIELFEFSLKPYTESLDDVVIKSQDHRRYTMKDIGKLADRVKNLERVTTLSLLEKDTQSMQIIDGDGFDRFKSGFLVDNFRGHGVGDVNHPDYRVAIDAEEGSLRPMSVSNFFDISLDTTNSANYVRTGDLITLPFTQVSFINQSKATKAINVNPYNVFAFVGTVRLSPGSDVWNDTSTLPAIRVNREGNFDTVLAGNANSLGTVWNNWQTTWVGQPNNSGTDTITNRAGSWEGTPGQGGRWVPGARTTRTITETPETQTRSGIRTSVVEEFTEDRNTRTVGISIIPFIRSRDITVTGDGFKPNTNHFVFFDGIDVDSFCTPGSSTYSQTGSASLGAGVKSDRSGDISFTFSIPNSSAQRFPTGERTLLVTASSTQSIDSDSKGQASYSARGLLQSNQTTITSTRNGRVVQERQTGSRSITRRGEELNQVEFDVQAPPVPVRAPLPIPTPPAPVVPAIVEPVLPPRRLPAPIVARRLPIRMNQFMGQIQLDGGWRDPLAQSFMVEADGGMFVSSVDLYFKTKDDSLPVNVEIRNMVNGYPGQIVLPFSSVSLKPASVNTSADGSTATTFSFESPVYLEDGIEYCVVVLSNSNSYEAFVSEMGGTDLITQEVIADQPYAGVLFKSQNASTWSAEQLEDLKFNLKQCAFHSDLSGTVRFNNDALDTTTLRSAPISFISGNSKIKVDHYSHGMYDASGNVTLTGIVGDRTNSVLTITNPSAVGSGSLPADGTYDDIATTTSGSGTGATVKVIIASSAISSWKIKNPGSGYDAADTLTVTNFGSATNSTTFAIDTVGDTLGGFPIAALNATFTALTDIEIDSYTVTPDVSAYDLVGSAIETSKGGGTAVKATQDYYFDTLHTMIPSLTFKDTSLLCNVRTTPAKSPEGVINGTQYSRNSTSSYIALNDNVFFADGQMIASGINENNEMSNAKSFTLQLSLQSFNNNLSPVIDLSTIGCLAIHNRINNVDTSSDVGSYSTFSDSTEPEGDNNAMVYLTKRVNLKTPATAIKVMADIFRNNSNDVKLMYKVLRNDESLPFDEIGWTYFNTNGSPDITVEADSRNFKEYEYTVSNIAEFTAFAIKVVGQGTKTTEIPIMQNFRAIALAT